jgi:HEAT repeat protein
VFTVEQVLHLFVMLFSVGLYAVAMIGGVLGSILATLAPFVLFMGLFLMGINQGQSRRKKRRELLVDQLGLVADRYGFSGILEGASVRLQERSTGSGKQRRYYTDFSARTGVSGLVLNSQSSFFAARDVTVGDPPFDETFRTYCGPEGLGWLGADVRYALRALRREGFVAHKDGVLTLILSGQSHSAEACERLLRLVAQVSVAMQQGGDLVQQVQDEPEANVRWRMLEALGQQDVVAAKIEARRLLQSDSDPTVRLQAALLLRHEAALLEGIRSDRADPTLRSAAASTLSGGARCVAVEVLARDSMLWVAAVGLAEGHEGPPMSLALLHVFDEGGLVQTAVATGRFTKTCEHVARALGKGPAEGVSDALLRLLDVDDDGVRRAAVQSLALVGSVADVPGLRAFEEGLGLFDGSLKLVVGQAIARIQTRGGGSSGQLSIVDTAGQAGAVSLAQQAAASRVPQGSGR